MTKFMESRNVFLSDETVIRVPATYTQFYYLDRDFNSFQTRMGTTVCSSRGLTSLIPCIFKRFPIKKDINKWPTNTTVVYNINTATRFDLARSSSG